ncbi:MAG: cytochrome c [Proteobacteria bacterium]|nr:cytochrome c [Pseudomonadota bacterium]
MVELMRAVSVAVCLAWPVLPAAAQSPAALPDGPGREVVLRACSQCHSLENVLRSRLTRRQWEARIDEMLARGAKLTDEEIDLVADYLSANFGPP